MILVGATTIPADAKVRGRVVKIDDDRRAEVVRYGDDCLVQLWNGTVPTRFLLTQEAAMALACALESALEDWEELAHSQEIAEDGATS